MAAWLPSNIPGIIAWFDPSDATTHTKSGSRLTALADKSGNGRNLAQASNGPLLTTLNGLPALNTDINPLVGAAGLNALADNSAVFVVASSTGWAATRYAVSINASTYYIYEQFDNTITLDGGVGEIAVVITDGTHIFELIRPSTGSYTAYVDGISGGSNTATSGGATFRIGASSNTGANRWSAPIGEVVLAPSTISTADRQKLEGYLAHKWGSAGFLAAGHPYKSAPPTIAGGTDALVGANLTGAAPTVGAATIGQKHGLAATGLTSTVPVLGMPAAGQIHGLAADGIAAQPGAGSAVIGQKHGLSTAGIETVPQVGSPALGHVYNLAGTGLDTVPVLGSGALAQSHALGGAGLTSGAVTFGTPVLAAQSGEDALAADGIASAATLGSPAIAQGHALSGAGLSSVASVGGAALGQSHALAGAGISASAAAGLPNVGQRHAIAANDIASAASFGAPAVSTEGTDALIADGLAVAASIGAPALGQAHGLSGAGVEAGAPTVGTPSLVQNTGLVAAGLVSGASLGSPALGQVHGFAAVAVVGGQPITGAADFGQVHFIAANDIEATPEFGPAVLSDRLDLPTPPSRTASPPEQARSVEGHADDRSAVAAGTDRTAQAATASRTTRARRAA